MGKWFNKLSSKVTETVEGSVAAAGMAAADFVEMYKRYDKMTISDMVERLFVLKEMYGWKTAWKVWNGERKLIADIKRSKRKMEDMAITEFSVCTKKISNHIEKKTVGFFSRFFGAD